MAEAPKRRETTCMGQRIRLSLCWTVYQYACYRARAYAAAQCILLRGAWDCVFLVFRVSFFCRTLGWGQVVADHLYTLFTRLMDWSLRVFNSWGRAAVYTTVPDAHYPEKIPSLFCAFVRFRVILWLRRFRRHFAHFLFTDAVPICHCYPLKCVITSYGVNTSGRLSCSSCVTASGFICQNITF